MEYLKIKNWEEYQHYKDRCPPWIKLHVKILNDMDFVALSCASRGLLMQLWILASEHDGNIQNDLEFIKFRLRDTAIKQENINSLIQKGFLISCKQVLADASECSPEKRREETETETEMSEMTRFDAGMFEAFWAEYPKKTGKVAVLKKWKHLKFTNGLFNKIMTALEIQKKSDQWVKNNGQFIPNPLTWLNQERWEDEVEVKQAANGSNLL